MTPAPRGAADPDTGTHVDSLPPRARRPLYWRLLRLRHVRPNGWQRTALLEGVVVLSALLVLADLASAWTLLVLPLAVAAVVKAHDVVAGLLLRPLAEPPAQTTTAPAPRGDRRRRESRS